MQRHWTIIDQTGQQAEVIGEGVIGRQPILRPGESMQYSSGTPLGSPSGIMYGTYLMRKNNGEEFTIAIPAFSLDSVLVNRVMH